MARVCTICEKTSRMVGRLVKLRGKYNPTIRLRKQPNLQWVRLPSGNQRDKSLFYPSSLSGKRVKACTKCIKALTKNRNK